MVVSGLEQLAQTAEDEGYSKSPEPVAKFLRIHNLSKRQYNILIKERLIKEECGQVIDSSRFEALLKGRAVFHLSELEKAVVEFDPTINSTYILGLFNEKSRLLEEAGLITRVDQENRTAFLLYKTDDNSWEKLLSILGLNAGIQQSEPTSTLYVFDWSDPISLSQTEILEKTKITERNLELLMSIELVRKSTKKREFLFPRDFWNKINGMESLEVIHVRSRINAKGGNISVGAFYQRWKHRKTLLQNQGLIYSVGPVAGNNVIHFYNPGNFDDIVSVMEGHLPQKPKHETVDLKSRFIKKYELPHGVYKHFVAEGIVVPTPNQIATTPAFDNLMLGRKILMHSALKASLTEHEPTLNPGAYRMRFTNRLPELENAGYIQRIGTTNVFLYSTNNWEDILNIMGKHTAQPPSRMVASRPRSTTKLPPSILDKLSERDASPTHEELEELAKTAKTVENTAAPTQVIETVSYASAEKQLGIPQYSIKSIIRTGLLTEVNGELTAASLKEFVNFMRGKQFLVGSHFVEALDSERTPKSGRVVEYFIETGLVQRLEVDESAQLYIWKREDAQTMSEILQQNNNGWKTIIDKYLTFSVYDKAVRLKQKGLPPFNEGNIIIYHPLNPDFVNQLANGNITGVYHPLFKVVGLLKGSEGTPETHMNIILGFPNPSEGLKASFHDPSNVSFAVASPNIGYEPTIWEIHPINE